MFIRKATVQDISRIAEILIFTKRINYRNIFQNDKVSFGEMQVLPEMLGVRTVWVLEKNHRAISFYQRHGFTKTSERMPEEGTPEFIVEMTRGLPYAD